MDSQNRLTRRQALKLFGMGAVGATLAACAPAGVPGQPAAESGGAAPAGEQIVISISHIGGGSLEASEQSQRMMLMRENFPDIEFENLWVSYAGYLDKIPLAIASNDLADLQFCNAFNDVPLMMENELLMEMDDLLAQYAPDILAVTPAQAWDSTIYDGRQYAVAHNIYNLNIWGTYYRQDWLDKVGLAVPTTIDEYAEVVLAYTKDDPDGNGAGDTYGRLLYNTIRFDDDLFHPFGVAVGHHMNGFWRMRGDALALDWVQPEMKDALAWMRGLWAEGVFHPDSITIPLGRGGDAFNGGIVGNMYSAWTGLDFTQAKVREVQPEAVIVAGPAVTGPGGNGFTGEGWPWVYVMPKTAQYQAKAVEVLNWFYTPEVAAQILCDGVLGVTNKGLNEKGWCVEYTPAEKEEMGAEWAEKQNSVEDIAIYGGLWLPYLFLGQTAPFDTFPDDMRQHFDDMLAAKYSPAALEAEAISQEFIRITEKKRPVTADKESWPGLQTRFAEFISQAVAGTVDLDSGWDDWLAYFEANGGPTITEQVNQI